MEADAPISTLGPVLREKARAPLRVGSGRGEAPFLGLGPRALGGFLGLEGFFLV